MAETMNNRRVYTLAEITADIRKTITEKYRSSYWIKAEMNKLNYYPASGHCYPDLVEKVGGKIIAEMRANLWSIDYQRINGRFIETLNEPLKNGIKILLCATVTFHPAYGLSLNIVDIDPGYTLGELEQEKRRTIEKLKKEGIFEQNKKIAMELLPQRIAIISVESSKGYADFVQVLNTNPWRYKFFHHLFPSLLQGDKAVAHILMQLKRIKRVIRHFDVVAIVRGGGGDIGLSCYNNFDLAKEVATFPIPVITGIGHSTNETVVEMIASQNAITPTALGNFLIQKFHNFCTPVKEAERKIIDCANKELGNKKAEINNFGKYGKTVISNYVHSHKMQLLGNARSLRMESQHFVRLQSQGINYHLRTLQESLPRSLSNSKGQLKENIYRLKRDMASVISAGKLQVTQENFKMQALVQNTLVKIADAIKTSQATFINSVQMMFEKEGRTIENLERNVRNLDPVNVLRRGYTMSFVNGRLLNSIDEVVTGDTVTTIAFDGEITSEATVVTKKEDHE